MQCPFGVGIAMRYVSCQCRSLLLHLTSDCMGKGKLFSGTCMECKAAVAQTFLKFPKDHCPKTLSLIFIKLCVFFLRENKRRKGGLKKQRFFTSLARFFMSLTCDTSAPHHRTDERCSARSRRAGCSWEWGGAGRRKEKQKYYLGCVAKSITATAQNAWRT